MDQPLDIYVQPTDILDSDHPDVIRFADSTADLASEDPGQVAVQLYYAVRDGIRYDPYVSFHRPEDYRASNILKWRRGYCVGKAALLCALARARNIPCRLGFATVRNHLASQKLIDYLGSDRFVYHGYVEFYLNGSWVKATPAFNAELCELHHVDPLEFDGRADSIYQSYNRNNQLYMEYLAFHGTYIDVPVSTIVKAWKEAYGTGRVEDWIDANEIRNNEKQCGTPDFYSETPL
jgi:transglutaminase-like putative cysteine protease